MFVKYPTQLLAACVALSSCERAFAAIDSDAIDDDAIDDDDDNDAPWKTLQEEEEDEIGYVQSLRVNLPAVASVRSPYQFVEVYDSDHFGKVFVLDDNLQLTERDAPHYNEMLAHVPVMEYLARRRRHDDDDDENAVVPSKDRNNNMRALVVGGGDGYVVSELLKHPRVESIDHVELDQEVINVSREHLPWGEAAWEDERTNLIVEDGAAFVEERAAEEEGASYHVIVQDASDPFWVDDRGRAEVLPSAVLYDESHFANLHRLLEPEGGVLVFQAETYNLPSNLEAMREWRGMLRNVGFAEPRYGSISVSTYPTGQIGFFVAHAREDEASEGRVCRSNDACGMDALPGMDWNAMLAHFDELDGKTLYYHPRIHRSSFDLPLWVEEYLYANNHVVDEE